MKVPTFPYQVRQLTRAVRRAGLMSARQMRKFRNAKRAAGV